MSKQEQEAPEYKGRLREMTAVLRKHGITRGVTPEKLRLILAQSGEWERMKEFGIKGVDNMDDLVQIMNKRFAGGMDKLAKTTGGIWSTVTGVVKNSLGKIVGIMDDGSVRQGSALDKVKTKLSELEDTLTDVPPRL